MANAYGNAEVKHFNVLVFFLVINAFSPHKVLDGNVKIGTVPFKLPSFHNKCCLIKFVFQGKGSKTECLITQRNLLYCKFTKSSILFNA